MRAGPTDLPSSPPDYAFVDAALDRADALRDDGDALDTLWPASGLVLLDAKGGVQAGADGMPSWPRGRSHSTTRPSEAVFLGLDRDGRGWFALARVVDVAAPEAPVDLRTAAANWPAFDATVFAQARAVLHWQARHRHCGACGAALVYAHGGWLGTCGGCGLDHYPRTDPAVIVAVSDGDRLLLGRQRTWPAGRWSVIAGFVEPGESLEQTVAREVHEETGVRVRACRYLASQPWPFPSALMLGFLAEADPQVPVAGDELQAVRWFDANAVRDALARDWRTADDPDAIVLSAPLSIARWLIQSWLDGQVRG
ncbi:NAD(+) diphosphatase [Luteimonas pelagia]